MCQELVESPGQVNVLHIRYIRQVVMYVVIYPNWNVKHWVGEKMSCRIFPHIDNKLLIGICELLNLLCQGDALTLWHVISIMNNDKCSINLRYPWLREYYPQQRQWQAYQLRPTWEYNSGTSRCIIHSMNHAFNAPSLVEITRHEREPEA